MTFPSSDTSLAVGLTRAQQQASSIKAIATNNSTAMKAGPVLSSGILSLLDNLVGAHNVLSAVASLDGIDAYAQEQIGVSIASDFTAMMNAITAAAAWIVTNFPASGGYLQAQTMNSDGARTERSFTTTQTAGLVTLLDALVATID